MKALTNLQNLKRCLDGELKEAWEYWMKKKENEKKETGESFNASGCYIPNAYESALSSAYQIELDLLALYEREFTVTKILLDNADNDY